MAAVTLLTGLAALWTRREFVRITVVGDSMLPTYRSGEKVLIRRSGRGRPASGDVVVVERPSQVDGWGDRPLTRSVRDRRWYLKRVAAIAGEPVPPAVQTAEPGRTVVPTGSLAVIGDNPHSLDSRHLGFFPADRVLGVVVRPKRGLGRV